VSENLEFAGLGIGPTEPGLQVGSLDISDSISFTGNAKHVPFVDYGHAFMPNLFDEDIRAGQDLYLIIKPVISQKTFFTPDRNGLQVPTHIQPHQLFCDTIFYTNKANIQPRYCSNTVELYKQNRGQTPLHDICYIDWILDTREKDPKHYIGELKPGMLWKLGRAYNQEFARFTTSSRSSSVRQKEPLPFDVDYNTAYKKMEVQLDPKRIFSYA
jgi:hypothetical protein